MTGQGGGLLEAGHGRPAESAEAKLSAASTEIMRGRTPKKSRLRTCEGALERIRTRNTKL
jgi:hypothetical protein